MTNLLIRDLRSSSNADLIFGVYSGGGAGGQQVMVFDNTAKGNVRIGPSSFASSSVGAGSTLSVQGTIVSGDAEAVAGSVILASRYSAPYPNTLNVFGSMNSTGNSVLSYGVRPKAGSANTFESTDGNNLARTAVEVGVENSDPVLRLSGLTQRTATRGSNLTLTELFKVSGFTATFAGFVSAAAGVSGPTFYGNAVTSTTATRLQTARTINGTAFDGTQNINLTIENSAIRQSSGVSVIGRSVNSTGTVADIVAGADDHVLMRSSGQLQFSTIGTNNISNNAITTAKISDGSVTGAKISASIKKNYVIFNSGTGSWTCPSNVSSVYVVMSGGGGGGIDGASWNVNIGRRGSLVAFSAVLTPGTSFNYEIGAGSAPNANGGNTTFLGVVATGGARYTAIVSNDTSALTWSEMPLHSSSALTGVSSRTFSRYTKQNSTVASHSYSDILSMWRVLTEPFYGYLTKDPVLYDWSRSDLGGTSRTPLTWTESAAFLPGTGGGGGSTNNSANAAAGVGGVIMIVYDTIE
jgi:hypothetical protein